MEPVTKRLAVTFHDGLPLGTHAGFKYEGDLWIAVPARKYTRIVTVTDRLLSAIARIRTQLTHWVGAHPGDAERVLMILTTIADIEQLSQQAAQDKIEAQTS